MATIAIRKATVAAMTAVQRKALSFVCERVQLTDFAEWIATNGIRWYVTEHYAISMKDVAILARVAATLASVPDINSWQELYDAVKSSIVLPTDSDTWQTVLAANGAPAALQVADGIPAGWVQVTS